MEVFADGPGQESGDHAAHDGRRIHQQPGTWLAMSSSPTLLRVPDFWSVMR